MSTNLLSSPIVNGTAHDRATEINVVRSAMSEMAHGIKKPKSVAWRLYDSGRGRVAEPLGPYPAMAHEIIDAGGAYHFVARPLTAMLAHLRRRCSGKMPQDMKDVLLNAKKESDEAEACALRIAFAASDPAVSDLAAFDREADEAIVALERAKEITEDKLAALEAR